ncbi:odorant receptor 67c-like isoform X2 [Cylas formicarius]|uniref:odorant receptor 67c-like isoform X2 n=1 Tax=Cylas formicarius TaxID=197179 RepID=UPI0029589440|nr:odorant receptor 67c-like isoform X2 [Cylas formicarius]
MPEVLGFAKYTMIGGGIWRAPFSKNPLVRKTYSVYSVAAQMYFLTFTLLFCTKVIVIIREKIAADILFRVLSYTLSLIIAQAKSLICQTRRVKQIFTYILEEETKIVGCGDDEVLDRYARRVKVGNHINLAIFSFTSALGLGAIAENIQNRLEIGAYNLAHNETLRKPFLYEFYYGQLDTEENSTALMWLNYCTVVIAAIVCISTQIIFLSSIVFVASVFETLQIRFGKLVDASKDTVATLKSLVVQHQRAIRFVEELNDAMKYLMLMEYVLASFNIASVLIEFITEKELTAMFLFGRSCYSAWLITNIFALGWTSNEIRVQSAQVANSIFETRWYEQSEEAKRILFIMLMRSQKPMVLSKGPFGDMTIETSLTEYK